MNTQQKSYSLNSKRYLIPNWPVPKNINALMTTRIGGFSNREFSSFNLAEHVGDQSQSVIQNREILYQDLGIKSANWLQQIHSNKVFSNFHHSIDLNNPSQGDAFFVDQPGITVAILTADCLPIFFYDPKYHAIALAHAGWRGILTGIIENTLQHFKHNNLTIYLGAAISAKYFIVGNEVYQAFTQQENKAQVAFKKHKTDPNKWHCDLYLLARLKLTALGVRSIYGGDLCTYQDNKLFYSYRRNRKTGRMASVIWMD